MPIRIQGLRGGGVHTMADFLLNLASHADRAESQLYEWAILIDGAVSSGIATREMILEYNAAANALWATQQRTYFLLQEMGWTNALVPPQPPFFGTSLTIERRVAGVPTSSWLPIGVQQAIVAVPAGALPQVSTIFDWPWWYDYVKKATTNKSAGTAGLRAAFLVALAPAIKWGAVALAVAVGAWGVAHIADALFNRGNDQILEYDRLENSNSIKRHSAYVACMVDFAKTDPDGDTLAHSKQCNQIALDQFPRGVPPTGWIASLVPVVKWVVIGGVAYLIGMSVMKRRQ